MAQRVGRSSVRVAIRTRPTAAWDQDEIFVDPANAHVQVHHEKLHKDAVSNAQEDWAFKFNHVLHNSTQCVGRQESVRASVARLAARLAARLSTTIFVGRRTAAGTSGGASGRVAPPDRRAPARCLRSSSTAACFARRNSSATIALARDGNAAAPSCAALAHWPGSKRAAGLRPAEPPYLHPPA
jgi:hypothetical protein